MPAVFDNHQKGCWSQRRIAHLCPGLCGEVSGGCLCDLNDDVTVDGADLGILLGSWTG